MSLSDSIKTLWAKHQYPMPFDLLEAWKSSRNEYYKYRPEEHKPLADLDAQTVSITNDLFGIPAERIDWLTWVIT